MKKLIPLLSILSSNLLSAFEKMEGPFYLSTTSGIIDTPNIQLNALYQIIPTMHIISDKMSFFYNKDTGYLFWDAPLINKKIFFESCNNLGFNLTPFLIKKKLEASCEGGYTRQSIQYVYTRLTKKKYKSFLFKDKNFLKQKIDLFESSIFITSSNVVINNEDVNTKLSKGNITIDIKQALLKYISDLTDIITQAVVRYQSLDNLDSFSKKFNTYKISDVANRKFNCDKALLENSIDISVLTVAKENSDKDSIIFGLAKDQRNEKKFYWITKIKGDISVLVNQYIS